MNYEKLYKEALEKASKLRVQNPFDTVGQMVEHIFPELKESEDERIRKEIIEYIKTGTYHKDWVAWLEKQESIDRDKLVKGVLTGVANSIMKFLDRNTLGMCLSNVECADLESAVINSDWSKVYDYMKKKLEKQKIKFDVLPGLYKCVGRLFDGTPEGRLLFEIGNVYRCLSKHDRAEFEISPGHCIYLEDPVVCKHFIPFKLQGEKPQGKSAFGAIKEEKVDNQNCAIDTVGPKFKVKYACGEYIVLDIKKINGVTYYVIEDKPNHIDYVLPDDCEIINGYGIKENDFPLPTKSEQKSEDKAEPKFKVGDWVVFIASGTVCQVEKKEKYYYTLRHILGDSMPLSFGSEHLIRLWTIDDVKDGDVISNGEIIVIFKHFEEPSYRQQIVAYIGLDTNGNIQITDNTWNLGIDKTKPATEEQRDNLMKAAAKAGYVWDDEKKELKKIETKFHEGDWITDGNITIQTEAIKNQEYGNY